MRALWTGRLLPMLLPLCLLALACQDPAASGPNPSSSTGSNLSSHRALPAREIIDSHVHLSPDPAGIKRALALFERNGITRFCVKSAGPYGSRRYHATVALAKRLGPRFAYFINLDWRGVNEAGWAQREAQALEQAMAQGAAGVKIFKALGLNVRNAEGKLLAVDDPKLDPIMETAAETGAIVALHTGDPVTFFDEPGPANERYLELLFAPSWSFWGADHPSRRSLMEARERLVARHPKTTFLGIHLANMPEDLTGVDRLLESYPNLYVDTSARIGEFGRHPAENVRAFFIKHADRILFGTDIIISGGGYQLGSLSIWPDEEEDVDTFYRAHREYFETDRKGLDHPTPIQGMWTVDGIGLPKDVLQKLYVSNAEKLIFARSRR